LIAGPSGGGKTNVLIDIIMKPRLYFEEITIYTKTPQQQKFLALKKVLNKVANDASIPPFIRIVNEPVPDPDTLTADTFKLVVFDDMLLEKNEMAMMTKFFVFGRHKRASVIFLTQSYYSTPKNIRINCTNIILFKVPTVRETRSVLVDNDGLTAEQYHANTEGFDCITINKLKNRITRNFDEDLI
jgi:hypothetical protein